MYGPKLKRMREAKNYSQEYMAAQLNIEQCTYSRIESGKIKLDLNKLKSIAKVLEVDLHKLIDDLELANSN